MSVSISDDGQNWREVTDEKFAEMLKCISVDCWVDISTPGQVYHVSLNSIRNWRECQGPLPWNKAKRTRELYGIPIVYEDGK